MSQMKPPLSILPFDFMAYEEVYSLWQRCEGVGLSSADNPEQYRCLSGTQSWNEFFSLG